MFVHVPLMTGTEVSQNSEILASMGNHFSCAQANGNGSISFAPYD